MARIIQLAFGVFMNCLSMKGRTKTWEAHERDQQFGGNESIDIGKSQRLRKEGNARINKVSVMRPGEAKIIETVCISTYFESPQTDLQMAENVCCMDIAHTWLSKTVHSHSNSQSLHRGTTHYGCKDTLELDSGAT
jgi:hypothetical protein